MGGGLEGGGCRGWGGSFVPIHSLGCRNNCTHSPSYTSLRGPQHISRGGGGGRGNARTKKGNGSEIRILLTGSSTLCALRTYSG